MADIAKPLVLYLTSCINLGYYLLTVPMKLKINECQIGQSPAFSYQIHTNSSQTILCALVYTLVFIHQLLMPSDVKSVLPATFGPFSYIGHFRKVLSIWYVLCSMLIFWKRRNYLLDICKHIQKSKFLENETTKTASLFVKTSICLIYVWFIYMLPVELFLDAGYSGSIGQIGFHLNATTALNRLYARSKRLLMQDANEEIVHFGSITYKQGIQVSCYSILYFFTTWIQTTLEILVLHSILLIWGYISCFERWYRKLNNSFDCAQVLNMVIPEYDEMKQLLWATNQFVGPAIIVVISLYLPIYAIYAGLITIKQTFSTPALCIAVLHYLLYFLQLGIAAEIHRKGCEFIRWASSPKFLESISPSRLMSLSMDLNSHQIALKGSGCFVLSYTFFSSIIGLMITYAILVVQFQEGNLGVLGSAKNVSTLE